MRKANRKSRSGFIFLICLALILFLETSPAIAQDQPALDDQKAAKDDEAGQKNVQDEPEEDEGSPAEDEGNPAEDEGSPETKPTSQKQEDSSESEADEKEGEAPVGEETKEQPDGENPEDEEGVAASTEDEPDETIDKGESVPADGEEEDVEEIVVTGTRIGRSNLEEYAHITVLSSEDIAFSGVSTVDDLLTRMPSLTLQGLNKNNNNGGNGMAFVDLRNLGTGRTLVLINGRRFVSAGEFGSGVDMNNIPVHLIERVEVLLDGASAIYGSDAIGGVINIILKKDFEGMRVDVGSGITARGDGEEVTVSATIGKNYDRGNVTINFTYYRRGEIAQRDRNWSKNPVSYETFNEDGSIYKEVGSPLSRQGLAITPGGDFFVFEPSEGRSYSIYDPSLHHYNYGRDQWLIGRMERFSLTALASYDVTENTTAYLEGTFTRRESRTQMAPAPLGGGTTSFPGPMTVPVTNPFIPQDFLNALDPGTTSFSIYRRMWEAGNRVWDNTANTFRLVLGVKGDITENYSWDTYLSFGLNRNSNILHNAINLARVWETLDPGLCAANANRGCVLGNYFGAGQLQPEVVDYIRYKEQTSTQWKLITLGASLTGRIVELPAGYLQAVFGGEARWESGFNMPDSLVTLGDAGGNLQDPSEGSYNVQEMFAELSIPILKGLPAAYDLTADLAGRFSNYDTFGHEFTYRAGLSWAPWDFLRLRGVYSTAFRAPSISDLYGGATDSYETVADPCAGWASNPDLPQTVKDNCAAQGVPGNFRPTGSQIRTNIGSNPDLEAEKASIWNVGLVLTSTFFPKDFNGLSVTFDYYDITIDNAISSQDPQYVIDRCYESSDMTHPTCTYVGGRGSDYNILGLDAVSRNISQVRTNGFDFTINYMLPIFKKMMNMDIGWHGNYLLSYEETNKETNEKTAYEGTIGPGGGSYAKLRWIATLGLSGTNWRFANHVRYIGGADVFQADSEVDPTTSIAAVAYWDISGGYRYRGWDFIAGVDNVTDVDPPYFPTTGQNANAQTHDFMGTYFYGKVGYQF